MKGAFDALQHVTPRRYWRSQVNELRFSYGVPLAACMCDGCRWGTRVGVCDQRLPSTLGCRY